MNLCASKSVRMRRNAFNSVQLRSPWMHSAVPGELAVTLTTAVNSGTAVRYAPAETTLPRLPSECVLMRA